MTTIDPRVSFNFEIAKVLAILTVVTGHFFDGSVLWVPVTVGLFVFAYSSAYFTSVKYSADCSWSVFWKNKVKRLAIPFWLTQSFLLMMFVAVGRDGIWTWQTLIHWLGQTGWLTWLGFKNASPFGNGLWFLTLLLIFYFVFPLIAYLNASAARARALMLCATLVALWLHEKVKIGHELWLTALGFWFGAYSARYPPLGSARFWFALAIAASCGMFVANSLGIKALNVFFLVGAAMATVSWLMVAQLPRRYLSLLSLLTPCLLEIYLIHTYLFVRGGLPVVARYIASVLLTLVLALLISRVTSWFERKLLHARPAYL